MLRPLDRLGVDQCGGTAERPVLRCGKVQIVPPAARIPKMAKTLRPPIAEIAIAASLLVASSGPVPGFDLQGHRGARGLAPENTLEAFAMALTIGVTTLETDLGVTSDGVLVLSHDPALNPAIARGPDGQWVGAPAPLIHSLTLAELERYDVGRLKPGTEYAGRFAEQRAIDGLRIPRLTALFTLADASGKRPRFNLETKLDPRKPAGTPGPDAFARLVVEAVHRAGLASRATIQSFDWRSLLAVKRLAPEIETVCLTSPSTLRDEVSGAGRRPSPWLAGLDPAEHGGSAPRLAKAAGCGTWSPHYASLGPGQVAEAHALGLKVVPWTVNEPDAMGRLIDMRVDGLITDYPDRARQVMAAKGLPLP
jgi:glycerophosphoryl diester phosphodiesterase